MKVSLIPSHASAGTETRRSYSPNPLTDSPLHGDSWSAPSFDRFNPGKDLIPIVQERGWKSGSFWTGTEYLFRTGIRFSDRPVHYVT